MIEVDEIRLFLRTAGYAGTDDEVCCYLHGRTQATKDALTAIERSAKRSTLLDADSLARIKKCSRPTTQRD